MKKLDFSIIIVTFNGLKYIDECVESIFNSNISNFEVIVVDNGSSDNTVSFLKQKYKKFKNFKIVELNKNYGPAKARNIGAQRSSAKYLGFLDNDTTVDKNWAIYAKKAFEKDLKLAIIQCKLLLANDITKIDYIGEYLGSNGFLVQKVSSGSLYDPVYDIEQYILSAKSAGMFIRNDVFKKIKGFDESYFIYVEETDLGFRSWIAGYNAKYIYKSVVYHRFGTSTVILGTDKTNFNAKFHGTKNYIQMHIKNLQFTSLIKILPIHVFLWEGLSFYSLIKGQYKTFLYINKAIFWNLINLPSTLKKRRQVQKYRKVNDKDILKIVMVKKPFRYYLSKVLLKNKVGNANSFMNK